MLDSYALPSPPSSGSNFLGVSQPVVGPGTQFLFQQLAGENVKHSSTPSSWEVTSVLT